MLTTWALKTSSETRTRTPTPDPSPQGGGESGGIVARTCLVADVFLQIIAAFTLLIGLLLGSPARAEEPAYPVFTGRVVDDAHVLSDADKADINRKLRDLQEQTGVQLAVATVPSLGGIEIEPYANGLFRKWGLGQKGSDNGLLLVLAPSERKLRFEVGRGLEGTFTDVQSKLILHNSMVPKLKANDPAGALKAGVDDAILVLTKDKASLPPHLQPDDGGPSTAFIVLAIIIIVIFVYLTIRGGGLRFSSGFTSGAVIGSSTSWSSSNESSSSSSSSDNDGFSGGGGGDSGGGGSSDSY